MVILDQKVGKTGTGEQLGRNFKIHVRNDEELDLLCQPEYIVLGRSKKKGYSSTFLIQSGLMLQNNEDF